MTTTRYISRLAQAAPLALVANVDPVTSGAAARRDRGLAVPGSCGLKFLVLATADGASMEPSGRNQWQSVANGQAAKTPETSEIRCHALPPVAATQNGKGRCRFDLLAKEGVDLLAPQGAKSCEPEGPQDLTARL